MFQCIPAVVMEEDKGKKKSKHEISWLLTSLDTPNFSPQKAAQSPQSLKQKLALFNWCFSIHAWTHFSSIHAQTLQHIHWDDISHTAYDCISQSLSSGLLDKKWFSLKTFWGSWEPQSQPEGTLHLFWSHSLGAEVVHIKIRMKSKVSSEFQTLIYLLNWTSSSKFKPNFALITSPRDVLFHIIQSTLIYRSECFTDFHDTVEEYHVCVIKQNNQTTQPASVFSIFHCTSFSSIHDTHFNHIFQTTQIQWWTLTLFNSYFE